MSTPSPQHESQPLHQQPEAHIAFDDLARLDPRPAQSHPTGPLARLTTWLRGESSGGILLMIAAAIAIVWANTPAAGAYTWLRDVHLALPLGFTTLDLSLGHWAADGLLAVFFFVVGLELKEEMVVGQLRDPRRALTPVIAAAGGVAVPALIFWAINAGSPGHTLAGWAIPTATDIAFAVAVLAVVGRWLPSPLRVFLLTLAVVDDLIAIVIIALFYAEDLSPLWLLGAAVPMALFGVLAQTLPRFFARHVWAPWVILLPLGFAAWVCMYQSGIHATIAGVVLGFLVPSRRRGGRPGPSLAQALDHHVGPLSAGICVPVFAFLSAGVAVGGAAGISAAFSDPVVWGIVVGLVVGKPLGILAATWLVTRTPWGQLDSAVKWVDLTGVAILGGVGFTVSLLVAELSYGSGSGHTEHAKLAILVASVLAAALAAAWLAPRNRHYKALARAQR